MKSKDEIAKQLAAAHRDDDPGIIHIARINAPEDRDPSEPIKLLEVNTAAFPSGIVPIVLGSTNSIPNASIIVEITPEEFERLKNRELKLPPGWTVGDTLFSD